MPPRHSLSLRELEVCQWAAEGKQVSDIGKILGPQTGSGKLYISGKCQRQQSIMPNYAIFCSNFSEYHYLRKIL